MKKGRRSYTWPRDAMEGPVVEASNEKGPLKPSKNHYACRFKESGSPRSEKALKPLSSMQREKRGGNHGDSKEKGVGREKKRNDGRKRFATPKTRRKKQAKKTISRCAKKN